MHPRRCVVSVASMSALGASNGLHILVVDDNEEVAIVTVGMLQELGYRASSVTDGASMRRFLAASSSDALPSVDAVVLDALMPGERGDTLAHLLAALNVPFVVASGSVEALEKAAEDSQPV